MYKVLILSIMILAQFSLFSQAQTYNQNLVGDQNFKKEDSKLFNWVVENQLGVYGSNYDGRVEIGSAPTLRAFKGDWSMLAKALADISVPNLKLIPMWYPNPDSKGKCYKKTLVGEIISIKEAYEPAFYEDFDVNIFIKPDREYEQIITESHPIEETWQVKVNNKIPEKYVTHFDCDDVTHWTNSIEAEINLSPLYQAQFLALIKKKLNDGKIYGNRIGCFGPWISDHGHCAKAEIHPSEQIWWQVNNENYSSNTNYSSKTHNQWYLNLICDNSERFNYGSLVSTKEGTRIKPWADTPLKGVFAIPFEIPVDKKLSFSIETISANNANAPSPIFDHKAYLSNAREHIGATEINLVDFNSDIYATIHKDRTDNYLAYFDKIGWDGSVLKGYLVIRSDVGIAVDDHPIVDAIENSSGHGGLLTLKVTMSVE